MEFTRNTTVAAIALCAAIVGLLGWLVISWDDDSAQYPIPGEGERIVVEVLNATVVDGLARTMTRRLRRAGIDVVQYGSSIERLDSTVILIRRGDSSYVGRIRNAIGGGKVVLQPDERLLVDASILLGLDVAPESNIEP